MKKMLKNQSFRIWLLIMGTSTILLGAAYTMVQQSTRLAANDLPLSASQTIKHQLEIGATPASVVPAVKTVLPGDSTVFAIITNSSRQILASSAQISGNNDLPPAGVFEFTKTHGSDQLTWQPNSEVRLATIVRSYKDGFIITGQSLSQAEDRISTYGWLAMIGWVAVLIWTSVILLIPAPKK